MKPISQSKKKSIQYSDIARYLLYKHFYIDHEYFDNSTLVQHIHRLESLSNIQI